LGSAEESKFHMPDGNLVVQAFRLPRRDETPLGESQVDDQVTVRMKFKPRTSMFLLGAAVGVVVALVVPKAMMAFRGQEQVTLTALSPDERLRVQIVEIPAMIDRNFELRIERLAEQSTQTVFRSPDEGRPAGSERIIWAADGSRFLLVGRHFYTNDAARLPSDEYLYLMYEVATGRIWCNATQQSEFSPFAQQDLEGVVWSSQFRPSKEGPPTTRQSIPNANQQLKHRRAPAIRCAPAAESALKLRRSLHQTHALAFYKSPGPDFEVEHSPGEHAVPAVDLIRVAGERVQERFQRGAR